MSAPTPLNLHIVSSYTRAEALEDGELVDCTPLAKEAGIRYPVAMTAAAHGRCVAWDNEQEATHQDTAGRLWDVLTCLLQAIRSTSAPTVYLRYEVLVIPRGGVKPELVELVSECGPGDNAEPVITIMLPNES